MVWSTPQLAGQHETRPTAQCGHKASSAGTRLCAAGGRWGLRLPGHVTPSRSK